MKLPASNIALATTIAMMAIPASAQEEESNMVKMCLMFETPSGHARSDPILNQECAADHVHTVSILCFFCGCGVMRCGLLFCIVPSVCEK
mmetsp:Transcript_3641/g.10280  ORF Transcript_3641/g.10280 Transcript_3641/m.10280 type:complete len:90 (-) Transcript_3641:1771-2040(-)